jgi:hypothetical protein
MSNSREGAKGMTEAEWLACTDPLRMPKMFRDAPVTRKYSLLVCAYLLDSPGALQTDAARRIVGAVRAAAFRAPTNKSVPELTAAAVREFLPECTRGSYYTLRQQLDSRREFGTESGQLAFFLADCAFVAPGRRVVNSTAAACLAGVQQVAWAPVASELTRLWQQHGAATDGYKEAVYALIPEPAQTAARCGTWTAGRLPARIRNRVYAAASRPRYAAASSAMADLVREVLGNPFRKPVIDPAWLECNHGAVKHIAEQIAATGNFADLPILADALEDAGCTDEHLLRHCREERVHVPGCWVLDTVLGK